MSTPKNRILAGLTQARNRILFSRNFITEMIRIRTARNAYLIVTCRLTAATEQPLTHALEKGLHLRRLICLHAKSIALRP